jgi:transposase
MTETTLQQNNSQKEQYLYMAFELSQKEWKLAFNVGVKNPRIVTIEARNLKALTRQIDLARKKFKLSRDCTVYSCYEAGRDGFWIHRYLVSQGINNMIVDSSSIEVNRRKRRAKTDRLDAGKLLLILMRYINGEHSVCSVLRVPTVEQEDARRADRELERLKKERNAHNNRIKSLLNLHGIVVNVGPSLPQLVEDARQHDGKQLGDNLKQEILRQYERFQIVDKQLRAIRKQRRQIIEQTKAQQTKPADNNRMNNAEKAIMLMALCGIGEGSSWMLVNEFFWRHFDNRRQVGGASGLTGTPYDSGGGEKEQGISKVGNSTIRKIIIQISWFWIRYQPESDITKWFKRRFGNNGKRMRRVAIVGVGRRLLIALWRYLEFGVVPEGARFKSAV